MKKKLNKFLFEKEDPSLLQSQSKEFSNSSNKKKINYSSIDNLNTSKRDRSQYIDDEEFYTIDEKEDLKKKSDLYDKFENFYEKQEKAAELALELKNNPGIIQETLDSFTELFVSILQFAETEYQTYVKQKNEGSGIRQIFIGDKPVFRLDSNGGYTFDAKLIDNFIKHQFTGGGVAQVGRILIFGIPDTFANSYVYPLGKAIADGYNLSVEMTQKGHEGLKKNFSLYEKLSSTLSGAADSVYNFFTDEQNQESINNSYAMRSMLDSGDFYDVDDFVRLQKKNLQIMEDKEVQEKLKLTKSELDLNRNITRNYFFNTVLVDEDDDDEINAATLSQQLEKSMKELIKSSPKDESLNKDTADFEKSFDRLKKYRNYTPEQLMNNPEIITEIGKQFEENQKNFEKNKDFFDDEEMQSIQKFSNTFSQNKDVFNEIKNNFEKIKQDPKVFQNIKKFYKDQGIFNVSTNLDTLVTNYKNYLKLKNQQRQKLLDDPLAQSEAEELKLNFRKELFLLRFHVKLIDSVVYFLNRFTEEILEDKKNSYRGNNFLSSIYQICLNDVNTKNLEDKKYESDTLDLKDIVKNFKDVNIITKFYNEEQDSDNAFTDEGFFSKDNKLLSNNDKIVGLYSRKKNVEKIEIILDSLRKHYNPSYERDEQKKRTDVTSLNTGSFGIEEPEPIESQNLDVDFELKLKLVFTKIELALKNIPLFDTIVLMTNKNSTNKTDSKLLNNDYLLYQIDISSLYTKIFNNPKLWDYLITFTLNTQNNLNDNEEFKISEPLNITEELKDFKIFDLRDYINTTPEEKIIIKYDNIETQEKNQTDINFKFESFQFLNKQITNKKESDLNPIELSDLFDAADLGFLTQNKNIFINI